MGKKSKLVLRIEKLEKELDDILAEVRIKQTVIDNLRDIARMDKKTVKVNK